jgi:hypothetical protein
LVIANVIITITKIITTTNGSGSVTFSYTIPYNTVAGNYSVLVSCNDYSNDNNFSECYYSLQIYSIPSIPNSIATSLSSTIFNQKPQIFLSNYNSTSLIINGCSFINTTNSNLQVISNLSSIILGTTTPLYFLNLVIQARPGDNITIIINVISSANIQCLIQSWVIYGSIYTLIYSTITSTTNNFVSVNFSYSIPANTIAGNYSILCCSNSASGDNNFSACYYSLQVYNQKPIQVATDLSSATFNVKLESGTYNSSLIIINGCAKCEKKQR